MGLNYRILDSFFPKSKVRITAISHSLFDESIEKETGVYYRRDSTIEDYIQSRFTPESNKKIKIRFFVANNDTKNINLFTIPYFASVKIDRRGEDINGFKFISRSVSSMLLLRKLNLRANRTQNDLIDVVFDSQDVLTVDIFATKGLLNKLKTNDVLFPAILHELGHWQGGNNTTFVISNFLSFISSVTALTTLNVSIISLFNDNIEIAYVVFLAIISNLVFLLTRLLYHSTESNADAFVKKLGYGKELADVLRLIDKEDVNESVKKASIVQKLVALLIQNHPHTKDRISTLSESIQLFGVEHTLFKLIQLLDNL